MGRFDQERQRLQDYLARQGLRRTHQRDIILEEFLNSQQHLTVEELWHRVREKDASIGYATVYRTLRLFMECGIADKHEFGEGSARFERSGKHHHDHLICVECHRIIEFENEDIERLQDEVCREYDFKMVSHKMELYGQCRDCRTK